MQSIFLQRRLIMKQLLSAFLTITTCITLISCGPSQREMATAKINSAKTMLMHGDTLAAINALDSVSLLYPKATIQSGIATNMSNEIVLILRDNKIQTLSQTDSLIAEMEKNFIKEKTEADRYVQYIPRRQTFSRSWNRSFLQVNLDERGELFLTSHYMGADWLNHTSIKVYDKGLNSSTEAVPLDDSDNRHSDFMSYKWEKVSYRKGKSDSVISFIDENRDLKLKCVFNGNKNYYILLESYDIQAITDALALSKAIKKRKVLQEEIKQLANHKN